MDLRGLTTGRNSLLLLMGRRRSVLDYKLFGNVLFGHFTGGIDEFKGKMQEYSNRKKTKILVRNKPAFLLTRKHLCVGFVNQFFRKDCFDHGFLLFCSSMPLFTH